MRKTLLALLVLAMIGGAAGAQVMSDDYNKYSGTSLGLWAEYLGDWNAVKGTAESAQVRTYQYLIWEDKAKDLKFKDCVAECLVYYLPTSAHKLQFGGIALRVGNAAKGTDLIHVKVQDNNSSGDFDTIYLYERPGGAASKSGIKGFLKAKVRLLCVDQKAIAEIDVDGDGLWDHVINKTLALTAKAGHVGLCAYGGAQSDNFKVFNGVIYGDPSNPAPNPGATLKLLLRGTPNAIYQAATSFKDGTVTFPNGYVVPLAPDPLFYLSVTGVPAIFGRYANALDAKGDGYLEVNIPKIPALVGYTFYTAFVTYDKTGLIDVSNDHQVTIK